MKHIPFLSICAVAFLPTPVEGIVFLLYRILTQLTFVLLGRDGRVCNDALLVTGIVNTDTVCSCGPAIPVANDDRLPSFFLTLSCSPLEENICLSPSDARFCTNSSLDPTSTYAAKTADTKFRLRYNSPKIEFEEITFNINKGDFEN